MTRTKAQRRAWWAGLTPAEQSAYIESVQARREAEPNAAAREATARLALAQELGIFTFEVPDELVEQRLRETEGRSADASSASG